MSKGKGSGFEREVCKALSTWWTAGERDDVFWRSSSSGGRATQRRKSGKKTYGQYGDVQACDPVGEPLTRLFVIEVKRGYAKTTIGNMLDINQRNKPQQWELWLQQVMTDQASAEVPAWMLITKRDRQLPLLFMPYRMGGVLQRSGASMHKARPLLKMRLWTKNKKLEQIVLGIQLVNFFTLVSRDNIEAAMRRLINGKDGNDKRSQV